MPLALALDIGGTTTRAALVDGDGRIARLVVAPTALSGEPQALMETVENLALELDFRRAAEERVVGVALPGVLDPATGVVRRAVNLPHLEGFEIRRLLETRLQRPIRIETDVIAAGVAQHRAITPPPARFAYLSIGTGIGGCVILGGEIVRHTNGGAGRLGHLIVDTSDAAPRCKCGARGCLEAVLHAQRGQSAEPRTAVPLSQCDTRASVVLHENLRWMRALSIALIQVTHIYAPGVIALGGGVIDHDHEMPDRAHERMRELPGDLTPRDLRIVRAELDSDRAGCIGAALLARNF